MSTKISDRQRQFAELVVQGVPAVHAYERAGYTARGDVAKANASRLLTNANVAGYLECLRQAAAEKAAFKRDDLVQFLVDVIRTPVGEIDASHPLAQKVKNGLTETTVEMPTKMQAAALLAQVMGWNKPQEVKADFSVELVDLVGRIRRQ